MNYLFIINPVAGRGAGLVYADKIKDYFKDSTDEVIIEFTKEKNHATELVKYYISFKDYIVFAIGGDGTVNEVANGLAGSKSILCVIPCGTGNDFAKTLYKNFKIENYLNSLVNGQCIFIDFPSVNNRYYLNIASIGFDSEVVDNARRFKKMKFIPSGFSYVISVFYTLFKYRPTNLKISISDKIIEQQCILLACSNGKCYGGGIYITPNAELTDGKFDLCLIRNCSLFKIIRCLPKVVSKTLHEIPEVSYENCSTVSVVSDDNFVLNVDGEIFSTREANFSLIPMGIKVMIPLELATYYNSDYENSIVI